VSEFSSSRFIGFPQKTTTNLQLSRSLARAYNLLIYLHQQESARKKEYLFGTERVSKIEKRSKNK
jgi:hypothetical protein